MKKLELLKYKKTILTSLLLSLGIFETLSFSSNIEATKAAEESTIICEINEDTEFAEMECTRFYCNQYGLNFNIVYPKIRKIYKDETAKQQIVNITSYCTEAEVIKHLVLDISHYPDKYGINDISHLYVHKEEEVEIDNSIDGKISPGTLDETFNAQAYDFTDEERKMLYAIVYAEASEHADYVESDSMGVASVILNRIEDEKYDNEIKKVIAAKGQFGGYKNKKYQMAMNDPSIIPDEMKEAVDRVIAGERNTEGKHFLGKGNYNKFH